MPPGDATHKSLSTNKKTQLSRIRLRHEHSEVAWRQECQKSRKNDRFFGILALISPENLWFFKENAKKQRKMADI